jgi:peroxiredoxin
MNTTRTDRIFYYLPVGCLVASLGLNVYLAAALKAHSSRASPHVGEVKIGTVLPPFKAKTLEGKDLLVSYGGQSKTILYFMSARCPWCKVNAPATRELEDCVRNHYKFKAVAPPDENLPSFVTQEHLTYPVLTLANFSQFETYGVAGTPTTVVVDERGVVVRSWTGAYAGGNRDQMAAFFGCKLQGAARP